MKILSCENFPPYGIHHSIHKNYLYIRMYVRTEVCTTHIYVNVQIYSVCVACMRTVDGQRQVVQCGGIPLLVKLLADTQVSYDAMLSLHCMEGRELVHLHMYSMYVCMYSNYVRTYVRILDTTYSEFSLIHHHFIRQTF